jgi:hypothetical protein
VQANPEWTYLRQDSTFCTNLRQDIQFCMTLGKVYKFCKSLYQSYKFCMSLYQTCTFCVTLYQVYKSVAGHPVCFACPDLLYYAQDCVLMSLSGFSGSGREEFMYIYQEWTYRYIHAQYQK